MALSEVEIRKAKATEKVYALIDGYGLKLLINPNGSKLWRYRYEYLGKESSLSLGAYPEVSLIEAREKRLEARKLLIANIDPAARRKEERRLAKFNVDNSFRAVANEWFDIARKKWSPDYAQKLWRRLEIHIMPALGSRPIAEISTLELLEALRRPEQTDKIDTAHRALQACSSIFRYGVLTQKVKYNPAIDLQGALQSHKPVNYPTIGHNQLPEFFERLEAARTSNLTRLAIKFLMLVFVRQGELRQAEWSDIDFNASEWRVRAETTKMRTLHHVPLVAQSVKVLRDIEQITGNGKYVFSTQQSLLNPIMSENTINQVLKRMGYKGVLVGHGFRSLASTVLNENGFRADVIERQLAHMPRDQVRAAYNRAQYLPERRAMMQWWADYLTHAGLK